MEKQCNNPFSTLPLVKEVFCLFEKRDEVENLNGDYARFLHSLYDEMIIKLVVQIGKLEDKDWKEVEQNLEEAHYFVDNKKLSPTR